jgi:16S rRNA (adenine1518-N6/adenine1519-N6)-dimethyltransferase
MTPSSRRRALGQHFLIDPVVADGIVDAAGIAAADLVCEIGAGEGVLTRRLAARAGRLVALEIDARLHQRLVAAGFDVRLADARRFPYEDLRELVPAPGGRVLVVGNLPYSVSKPILLRLWEARAALDAATLMLQREVAERLVAAPGGRAYGVLSVLWQTWVDLRLGFTVPPAAFRPPPAVDSAVIHAAFRPTPCVALDDPGAFVRVVKAAFTRRRKTLANSLRAGFPHMSSEEVVRRLARAALDGRRRAETLSLDEFARLARFFAVSEAA